jgi:hypothetical protein
LVVEADFTNTLVFAEEPQMARGIVDAVLDPTAHQNDTLAEEEAVCLDVRLLQFLFDFSDECRSQPFIGVQVQDPADASREVLLRPVALSGLVLERVLNELGTSGPGDLERLVGAAEVHNKNITTEPRKRSSDTGADSPPSSISE